MSSLFRAGKKLVEEFKPMIAPNRDNTQYQSQNPYGSPTQPYPSQSNSFSPAQPYSPPSTNLSPYFHQQSIQTSSSTNLYAHTPQYQSPPPQPQNAAGGYFGQQQLQPQPQPQIPYSAAQSPFSPTVPQQPQNPPQIPQVYQNPQQSQYYQPQSQQYLQPQAHSQEQLLRQPSPSPGQQYPQPQAQQHQDQDYQQYSNPHQNLNPPVSPAILSASPAPPQQDWTPRVNNTSTWPSTTAPTAAPATSEAPIAAPTPSAVELPTPEMSTLPATQQYHGSPPPDTSTSPVPQVTSAPAPSHIEMEQPQPQFPSQNNSVHRMWTPISSPSPQYQGPATNPTPGPANAPQYFPPPPNTTCPPVPPSSPPQQMKPQVQPLLATTSPPPQGQPYSNPNQQTLVPWYQPPQQQYQAMISPLLSSPYQSPPQDNQIMDLQQGFQTLSVTPALSSSFKEVTRPVHTSTPPKKSLKNEPGPSVLRVQTEGHASALRKILCLDGGGVRGLASLMILKHLMDRLESQRGGRLEPWQEFDMISGTSTGGLIAIMLGRLRMTVEESIEAYKTLSQRIFSPVHSRANIAGRAITTLKTEGKFESEPLEQVVKEMCRNRGLSEAELLKDNSDDSPKVFVCAAQGVNADAVVIRSYKSGDDEWDDLYDICKIWEAARATSAASTFFPPIQIGYQKYVDGALRYNNPIEKADQESRGTQSPLRSYYCS